MDLLGFGNPSPDRLTEIFLELCLIEVEADGVEFDPRTVVCGEIRARDEYACIRVKPQASIGKAIQVDVGFGDACAVPPEKITFPVYGQGRAEAAGLFPPEQDGVNILRVA